MYVDLKMKLGSIVELFSPLPCFIGHFGGFWGRFFLLWGRWGGGEGFGVWSVEINTVYDSQDGVSDFVDEVCE